MKRRILALFLAALTLVTLTTAALADDTVNGAYNVQSKSDYTLRVDGVENDGGFYANADTFTLTLKTAPTEQTLVYLVEGSGLPTEANLQYIDQSGSGTAFTLKPKTLESGKTYRVYVSTKSKAPVEAGSFSYGEKPEFTLGDVNDDGYIDTVDALWILQCYVKKRELSLDCADVNRDGMIDTVDALKVLQFYVGKITSFE